MSGELSIPTPPSSAVLPSSVWDRLTNWAARHKTIIYTTAATSIIITAGGIWYYTQRKDIESEEKRKREKSARKKKQKNVAEDERTMNGIHMSDVLIVGPKDPKLEEEIKSLPDVTEESVKALSLEVLSAWQF